jgi:hypothetical protein
VRYDLGGGCVQVKSPPIQLGMLGVSNVIEDFHVVAAHSRLMANGTLAFVHEHLRFNPPSKPRGPSRRVPHAPVDHHPSLFAAPPVPEREPVAAQPRASVLPGQLSLWTEPTKP